MLVELVDIVSVWTLLMALGDVVNTFCFRMFGPVSFPVATAMPEPSWSNRCDGAAIQE